MVRHGTMFYDIFLRTGACVWMVAELLLASAIRLHSLHAPQELLWRSVLVLCDSGGLKVGYVVHPG